MSQASVTQSARKAFGNVSNVKGSFKNTERVVGKAALVSGNEIAGLTKDHHPKKVKDLKETTKTGGLSASCKKVTSDKALKSCVKSASKSAKPASVSQAATKEKVIPIESKSIPDQPSDLESFYPMDLEDKYDLSSPLIDQFGSTDEIQFEEEEDLPNFMKKPFRIELDLLDL